MPTSPCVPFRPPMAYPAVGSLQEDRRGRGQVTVPAPEVLPSSGEAQTTHLRQPGNQAEEKSKYWVEWVSFEEHAAASRPSGVRGASEDGQDSEAK